MASVDQRLRVILAQNEGLSPRLIERIRLHLSQMNESSPSHSASECMWMDAQPDPTNHPVVIGLFVLIYIHIFVLGLIGNMAVIYLTFKHRHLQTVQNMFILNLALSDVIVCLLSMPFTLVINLYKLWFFGAPFCHLLPMVQGISIFVATFSLSAIALDRYNLVVRPHAHPLNTRGACLVAAVLWVVSVVVCLPYGWYMEIQTYPGICGEYCSERWPSQEVRKGYSLLVLATQFLLPFATMAVCYYTIFSVLKERAAVKLKKISERTQLLETSVAIPQDQNIDPNEPLPAETQQRLTVVMQQRRTTTILASMVLLFGGTWLPYNLYTLLIDYGPEDIFHKEDHANYLYLFSLVTHSFAMLTIVANPFLYAWLNPSFKEILLKTLRRGRSRDLKYHTSLSKSTKATLIRSTTQPASPTVKLEDAYQ